MTRFETQQGIWKVDAKGRVQTPPERREALLDEFERSGLRGKRFAEIVGVVPVTFSAWVCQRRRNRTNAKKAVVDLMDITRLVETHPELRSSLSAEVADRIALI